MKPPRIALGLLIIFITRLHNLRTNAVSILACSPMKVFGLF